MIPDSLVSTLSERYSLWFTADSSFVCEQPRTSRRPLSHPILHL